MLIRAANRGRGWLTLFLSLGAGLTASVILAAVYNGLPGSGMMPGLTYIGEFLISLWAAVGYILLAAASVMTIIIKTVKKK